MGENMSVPTSIADLSTSSASNSPIGSDSIGTSLDDYLRAIQAIVRSESINKEWILEPYTHTYTSGTSFTIAGTDVTSTYSANRRVKAIGSTTGTIYGTISSSSFSTNTTVNVTWDSGSLSNETLTIYLGAIQSATTNSSLPSGLVNSNTTLSSLKFSDLGYIADANGNELMILDTVASAVNELTIANGATGNNPTVSASGGDTNVGVNFQAKGTGAYRFLGTSDTAASIRLYEDTDNGSNYIALKAPASIASDFTITYPNAVPTSAGQVMAFDTSGNASFVGGRILQIQESFSSTYDNTSTVIPYDNSIPQISEGKEFTTISFTPISASSTLVIECLVYAGISATSQVAIALFVDATANALAAGAARVDGTQIVALPLTYKVASGSTSSRTYRLRYGPSAGTAYINGASIGALYNGVMTSGIRVTEILV